MRHPHPFPVPGVLAVLAILAAAPAAAPAGAGQPALVLPLDCRPGETCEVIKYVDHDPGPGMRDYACGSRTGGDDGYAATSIAIADRPAMEAGVAVFAAAAGTVLRTRDGMPDTGVHGGRTREELSAQGCGNAVVMDHGEGWTSYYCHLRMGSVRVRPGDRVEAGQAVAQVGMSGLSELPHLHFGVRLDDRPVDPFVGLTRTAACGPGARPLWRPEVLERLTYRPVLLRAAGFAAEPPELRRARDGAYAPASLPVCPERLFLWAEIIGLRLGDRVTLRIQGPPRTAPLEQSARIGRDHAQYFVSLPAIRPPPGWPAGAYRGTVTVTRDGRTTARDVTATLSGC